MEKKQIAHGAIFWTDLTTSMADELREFYQAVAGWETEHIPMKDDAGEYADYVMKDREGNAVAGVCHHRGVNLQIPPQWIIYIHVDDVEAGIQKSVSLGAKLIKEYRNKENRIVYAMIQDPAGAVFALTKS